MIYVNFNCACPYVGYTLLQADLSEKTMKPCTMTSLTDTGYEVFQKSGSYMILGTFEGRRYFHIRQSASRAVDEQNRPIYTNLALTGTTAEDARAIGRIACYALLDEDSFYHEIAAMIRFEEDSFSVPFDTLQEFLNRFKEDFAIKTSDAQIRRMYQELVYGSGKQEMDMVVCEATWDHFLKQTAKRFKQPAYCLTRGDIETMRKNVKISFGKTCEEHLDEPERPVQEQSVQERRVQEEKTEKDAMFPIEHAKPEEPQEKKHDESAETIKKLKEKLAESESRVIRLTGEVERSRDAALKGFIFGALAGIALTALIVWIF